MSSFMKRQRWMVPDAGVRCGTSLFRLLKGTIVIMLILRMVGALLNTGYEQIYLMSNALNRSVADVFDTYVYRIGVSNGQYSFATAVGIFKGIVRLMCWEAPLQRNRIYMSAHF